eukprot:CAMPEP_0172506362 /NCGR_PEP_ID=MMETSP1066-20121228/194388_1 /TAXON_ID=671091 /ORGANISM="Coscinodiscus wailesii, Strain CCMP2513" /LENGTH=369 /DNA_ID=CAMNT_0013283363 /DNA_START=85 /DNA_END=1191 /DNA_ORIENTATION=+
MTIALLNGSDAAISEIANFDKQKQNRSQGDNTPMCITVPCPPSCGCEKSGGQVLLKVCANKFSFPLRREINKQQKEQSSRSVSTPVESKTTDDCVEKKLANLKAQHDALLKRYNNTLQELAKVEKERNAYKRKTEEAEEILSASSLSASASSRVTSEDMCLSDNKGLANGLMKAIRNATSENGDFNTAQFLVTLVKTLGKHEGSKSIEDSKRNKGAQLGLMSLVKGIANYSSNVGHKDSNKNDGNIMNASRHGPFSNDAFGCGAMLEGLDKTGLACADKSYAYHICIEENENCDGDDESVTVAIDDDDDESTFIDVACGGKHDEGMTNGMKDDGNTPGDIVCDGEFVNSRKQVTFEDSQEDFNDSGESW